METLAHIGIGLQKFINGFSARGPPKDCGADERDFVDQSELVISCVCGGIIIMLS